MPHDSTESIASADADKAAAQAKRAADLKVFKLLMSLIGMVFFGMGALAVKTEHYYGRYTRHGSGEVVLDGAVATHVGIGLCVFGLLFLAVWARSPKVAAAWAAVCIALGFVLIKFY